MLISMTGYGEASIEVDGMSYVAQVRTVNNRYLKINIKLPDNAAFLEDKVDKLIKKHVTRGTVNFSLRVKNISAEPLYSINKASLKSYLRQITEAADNETANCTVNMADLISLPGVIQPHIPNEQEAAKLQEVVTKVTDMALEKLSRMRESEGKALEEDLLGNCQEIETTLANIAQKSPEVVKEYHDKLQKRVDELISNAQLKVDEQTLTREVAIFADRSDIAEEVTRLSSHIKQFRIACGKSDSIGRKMDFISQEMLRETNTIGSKASNSQIGLWVVDIKCLIEKLKEQVQNVE